MGSEKTPDRIHSFRKNVLLLKPILKYCMKSYHHMIVTSYLLINALVRSAGHVLNYFANQILCARFDEK